MVTKIELLITRVSTLLNQHLAGLVRHRARDIDIEQIGNETGTIQVILDRLIAAGSLHAKSVNYLIDLRAITNPEEFRTVQIIGYSSVADGGEGHFEYDAAETAADDGGTIIKPNSVSGAGRWKRVYSGALDVRWFGARGDGDISGGTGATTGTDDTAAVQRAIDAAIALDAREVRFLSMGANRGYRIRDTLSMPAAITLRGVSHTSTAAAVTATLIWDPVSPNTTQACIYHDASDGNAGGGIEDLLLFQNSACGLAGAGIGIHLKHSSTPGRKPSHFHIRDVFVDAFDANPWTKGIFLEGTPDTLPTDYLRDCYIERTRVTGCALPGIPKVFTSDHTTDTLTSAGHGYNDGDEVRLFTTGALPSPLSILTTYFVRDKTPDTFKLAASSGGLAIPLTDNGTGTHNVVARTSFKSGGAGVHIYACANIWLTALALNNQCRILIDSDDTKYFTTVVYMTACMIDELEVGNAQDVYIRGGRYDAIQCHSLAQNNIFSPDFVAVKPTPLGGTNNQYMTVHAPTADLASTCGFAMYDTASSTLTTLLRLSGGFVRINELGGFVGLLSGASNANDAAEGDWVLRNQRAMRSVNQAGNDTQQLIQLGGDNNIYLGGDLKATYVVAGKGLAWENTLRGHARATNALINTNQTLAVSLGITTDIDLTVWAQFQFRKTDGTVWVTWRRAVFKRISGTLTRIDDAVETLGTDRPSGGVGGWSVDIAKNGNDAVELLITAENNVTVITDYEWSRTA